MATNPMLPSTISDQFLDCLCSFKFDGPKLVDLSKLLLLLPSTAIGKIDAGWLESKHPDIEVFEAAMKFITITLILHIAGSTIRTDNS